MTRLESGHEDTGALVDARGEETSDRTSRLRARFGRTPGYKQRAVPNRNPTCVRNTAAQSDYWSQLT
jgi:hypothetical protein